MTFWNFNAQESMDPRKSKLASSLRGRAENSKRRLHYFSLEYQFHQFWLTYFGTSNGKDISEDEWGRKKVPLLSLFLDFIGHPLLEQYCTKSYTLKTLGSDLLASITNACLLIPGGIAYSLLAGVPSNIGLTSCVIPGFVYFLSGSGRQLSIGGCILFFIALQNKELICMEMGRTGSNDGSCDRRCSGAGVKFEDLIHCHSNCQYSCASNWDFLFGFIDRKSRILGQHHQWISFGAFLA